MIALYRQFLLHRRLFLLAWLLVMFGLAASPSPAPAAEERSPTKDNRQSAAVDTLIPHDREDLLAIQTQVEEVIRKVVSCTVAVSVGGSSGSGVIVRPDGYVLTAGHVSAEPGREVTVVFADGRRVKGKTLGANHGPDSGLIKITEEGPWPFAEMGRSADLKPGQWCVAIGHPRGYIRGRTPVVRLGRIQEGTDRLIRTDCAWWAATPADRYSTCTAGSSASTAASASAWSKTSMSRWTLIGTPGTGWPAPTFRGSRL